MKLLISSILIGLVFLSGVALAQSADLPSAGITPGSPLFFCERFFENVGTFFTFGEANKAKRFIALAEERLAEAKVLAERGDKNAERASELYEEQFTGAKERAERSGNEEALARVTEATSKHFAVLEGVIEKVPEQAKAAVQKALENSKQGQISALQALSEVSPDQAVEAGANAAKEIVQQVRTQVTERKAEALGQNIQHFEGVFESFANAPRGRADVEAKFSEQMTEVVNELDEVSNEAEDAGISTQAMLIENAKDKVITSQLSSLNELVREDPEKAIEIFANAAEGRLNAARKDAEERNGEATKKSLEDYNKYAEFGQQISTMAEGIQTGETTVEDLVKKATSHHLQVLEEVRQKLPVQAQQEFQRAIDNATRVQEQRPATPAPAKSGTQPQTQPAQPEAEREDVEETERGDVEPEVEEVEREDVEPEVEEAEREEVEPETPGGRP